MPTTKKLPLVAMRINPENGSYVSAISIVDRPAIGSNFIAFSKDEPTKLQFSDDERRELIGAAMIPLLPMYRNTPGVGEYMSVFDEETIREIAQVFAAKGFHNNMNIQHSDKDADSFVFQSYITDPERGINAPTGLDVPPGTWIVGVKVNSPELWREIKAGTKNGFSVEGLFNLFETELDLSVELLMSEEFKALVQEFSDALEAIPKGCLMFFPDVDLSQWELKARTTLPGANELELDPHITILYGFPDDEDNIEMLRGFLGEALNIAPLELELNRVSKFTNDENDVVKIDIYDCNGSLYALNTILSDMFAVVSDYGMYKPHMTIGYAEPNDSLVYSADKVYAWEFGINNLNKGKIVYSDANRNITELITIK